MGQTISLAHLAPYVDASRQKLAKELREELDGLDYTEEKFNEVLERRVKLAIKTGVQTMQYQILTLNTTNGQAPFVSLCMYLGETEDERTKADLALIIEEVLKQRIKGVQNPKGVWVAPTFPKLLYVLEEDNITEDAPYWYLTKLAAECTAKRMVPDYISEKVQLELKYPDEKILTIQQRRDQWGDERIWGINPFKTLADEECAELTAYVKAKRADRKAEPTAEAKRIIEENGLKNKDLIPRAFPVMGCRSMLTPDYVHYKYYGRFNQGVVTINLPDVALSSKKDMDKFWKIFDERLELCHKALQVRHNRLRGTPSDVAPLLWQHGALARLDKGETIDKLLYGGYSTISLGYAGLWECVYYMTGKKLTEPEGRAFGIEVMQKMNDYTMKWREAENIHYSLYGTPIESTTYKFAKCLQRRFGVIEGVTDKNYVTNSYHIEVTEPVNAFDKIRIESEFQALSPGGCYQYDLCCHLKPCEPQRLSGCGRNPANGKTYGQRLQCRAKPFYGKVYRLYM